MSSASMSAVLRSIIQEEMQEIEIETKVVTLSNKEPACKERSKQSLPAQRSLPENASSQRGCWRNRT